METLTLAQFDELVAEEADNLVAVLEEFNRRQANPEAALCSAKDLRGEFAEYFRKLLSAEVQIEAEVAAEQQADSSAEETAESSEASPEEAFASSRKKYFNSSES